MLMVAGATFLMLSGIDFFLTWKLIAADDSEISEINPVASWVLQSFGWGGLAVYKVSLVAAIACVVFAIAWRRRMVAESVSIFGCGAQAAVVISSLLLLQGRNHHADAKADVPTIERSNELCPILPPGAFTLLRFEFVQKELELPSESVHRIQLLEHSRRSMKKQLASENMSDMYTFFHDHFGQECALAASLTPKQFQRLQQLCLQATGPYALFDPNVKDELGLTEEQIDALGQIREKSGVELDSAGLLGVWAVRSHQADPEQVRVATAMLAILNADQRSKWQEMNGTPFRFALSAVELSQISPTAE